MELFKRYVQRIFYYRDCHRFFSTSIGIAIENIRVKLCYFVLIVSESGSDHDLKLINNMLITLIKMATMTTTVTETMTPLKTVMMVMMDIIIIIIIAIVTLW